MTPLPVTIDLETIETTLFLGTVHFYELLRSFSKLIIEDNKDLHYGSDYGGVFKEYVQKTIDLVKKKEIFFSDEMSGCIYPAFTFDDSIKALQYRTGRLIGICFLLKLPMAWDLPPVFFKLLFNWFKNNSELGNEPDANVSFQDLKDVNHSRYKLVLDFDKMSPEEIEAMSLDFSISESALITDEVSSLKYWKSKGYVVPKELISLHNTKKVYHEIENLTKLTATTIEQYKKHLVKHFCGRDRWKYVIEGFFEAVPKEMLMTCYELSNVSSIINHEKRTPQEIVKYLKSICEIEGSELKETDKNKLMQWLWKILEKLSDEDMQKFLRFTTSCVCNNPQTFKVTLNPRINNRHLPTANTCFHELVLPMYNSKSVMERKLKLAIQHCEGFGLA